jgi:hypothetical protein
VKVEGSDRFTLIWSRGGGDWPTPDHRPCLFGGRAFFALRSLPPRKRNSIFFLKRLLLALPSRGQALLAAHQPDAGTLLSETVSET